MKYLKAAVSAIVGLVVAAIVTLIVLGLYWVPDLLIIIHLTVWIAVSVVLYHHNNIRRWGAKNVH